MTAPAITLESGRQRAGLKGPRAADWLAAQGWPPPPRPNTWGPLPAAAAVAGAAVAGAAVEAADVAADDAPLAARLGSAEFFVEARAGGVLRGLEAALERPPRGVYPVLRDDWSMALAGVGVHAVLAEVCSFDFAALSLADRPVVMTSMIGVSVLIVPRDGAGGRRYRIWCDPSFGPYVWGTLRAVVAECGGTATEEGR